MQTKQRNKKENATRRNEIQQKREQRKDKRTRNRTETRAQLQRTDSWFICVDSRFIPGHCSPSQAIDILSPLFDGLSCLIDPQLRAPRLPQS
jgi:hypothetical protein